MLKWIERVIGGRTVQVPEGVPAAWAEAVQNQLSHISKGKSKLRAGLAQDIFSYVMCESPISVLQEASSSNEMIQHLGIGNLIFNTQGAMAERLYKDFDAVPAEVMLRWARLLAVVYGSGLSQWRFDMPNGAQWPEALVLHAAGRQLSTWGNQTPKADKLSAAGMERLLIADGLEPSALLRAAFASPADRWGVGALAKMVSEMRGFEDALERHQDALRPLLLQPAAAQRLQALSMLEEVDGRVLAFFAEELSELAASSSKQVRAAAEPLVLRCQRSCIGPMKRIAETGKPEQRLNALRLLHLMAKKFEDAALAESAREIAAADKAPSVQALVVEWGALSREAASATPFEFERPRVVWSTRVTADIEKDLRQAWDAINGSVEKHNRQVRDHHARMTAEGRKYPLHLTEAVSEADLRALIDYLGSDVAVAPKHRKDFRSTSWRHMPTVLRGLAAREWMTASTLMKLLAFSDLLLNHDDSLSRVVSVSINELHARTGTPSLLELSAMLEDMGFKGRDQVFRAYCGSWGPTLARDWPAEAVWPFFAHHLERLLQLMNPVQTRDYWFDRLALYRAVATLPEPPTEVVNALFDLALGSGKTDRLPAQQALDKLPGKEARIIAALADGKADVRTTAAQWLGRLRCEDAIEGLERAVAKEKLDVPKGAMLDTLQLMGRPVEKYLDRGMLAGEAEKTLAKGVPKDLDWFPWAGLPTVRWSDSGEAVPVDVLRWMLVQAVKQKSPEPNAVLRKYCAMFAPRDREALGQFVLEAWLAEDVRPVSPEQAMAAATSTAQSIHGYMSSHPQYYKNDPNFGRSVEELIAKFLPGCLRQPGGSATGSKGLLAVVAACAGERAVAPVARFLKEYYGTRAAQGKALIAMLAWIEHPSATQLMLSVGSRFRTKSFQEEATRQAEALAERKGWTLSELADRTIPSAGFDETGTLELSYGDRMFTAKLLPDFKIELFNPDGKKTAALPEPRQDDDGERAKDAKKAFSAAKKEIKNIVALQTERLYEALCTARDWPCEDWQRFLNQHPVMRYLVQRLIWSVIEDGRVLATFRPLEDGTLSDNDDNPVSPAADTRVRLAHDSNLPSEDMARWQQHLVDYEVAPLFQQFGKGTYTLPADKKHATSIDAFEGHLIEAFALRGRALKLGYTRGPTEDGGWFMTYEKRFPTLGMKAVIEFTGNPLPEENRTVALLKLSFEAVRQGGDAHERSEMPLSDVPAVLLSECYNDVRLIARDGSGFDPDWQKKSEY